jgi:tRNA(Arg) A34 adenosine deaminase TadA
MAKVIASITTSVDGYIAGPDDGPGKGLGEGGERLHYWVFDGPWSYGNEPKGEPSGEALEFLNSDVLAEDRNTVLTERDITAHPELKLARWAGRRLDPDVARQTTMYTSCQPCPMCAGAIARSGLGRVVFALSGEQLQELNPPAAASPDAAAVAYEGPALFAEARAPIDGYYA